MTTLRSASPGAITGGGVAHPAHAIDNPSVATRLARLLMASPDAWRTRKISVYRRPSLMRASRFPIAARAGVVRRATSASDFSRAGDPVARSRRLFGFERRLRPGDDARDIGILLRVA